MEWITSAAQAVRTLTFWRRIRQLPQQDIARTLGLSQARISHVEASEDLKLSTFLQYAGALGFALALVPENQKALVEPLVSNDSQPGKPRFRLVANDDERS